MSPVEDKNILYNRLVETCRERNSYHAQQLAIEIGENL
jgi:hypothetical protein